MKFDHATILAAGVLACMKNCRPLFEDAGQAAIFEQIIEGSEQAEQALQDETEADKPGQGLIKPEH